MTASTMTMHGKMVSQEEWLERSLSTTEIAKPVQQSTPREGPICHSCVI
jgi:hypothetical protein